MAYTQSRKKKVRRNLEIHIPMLQENRLHSSYTHRIPPTYIIDTGVAFSIIQALPDLQSQPMNFTKQVEELCLSLSYPNQMPTDCLYDGPRRSRRSIK